MDIHEYRIKIDPSTQSLLNTKEYSLKTHTKNFPVERSDLKILEGRIENKIIKLCDELANLTYKVKSKNTDFEDQFRTLENTLANGIFSKPKRVRTGARSSSARRSRVKSNLALPPKNLSKARKSSLKRSSRGKD